jgi:sugar lactone lactonase YvrE
MSTAGNPVDALVNDRAGHAESPVWSPDEGALYWLDARRSRIYRYELATGKRHDWPVPARLGAIALRRGGLIVALKTGIGFLDTSTGSFELLAAPESDQPQNRINDAKLDRAGRFWFGTQDDEGQAETGRIYRFDADRSVTMHDEGFINPNGFAWSPDDRLLYLADSRRKTIYAYDFDLASGSVRNRRPFLTIRAEEPHMDGATVDSKGYLWTTRYGAGFLARYAPDGSIDRRVELPTTHITNVALGGDDLRTLFVTTAAARHTPEQLAAQPLAGAILMLRVDVPGIPEPVFAG